MFRQFLLFLGVAIFAWSMLACYCLVSTTLVVVHESAREAVRAGFAGVDEQSLRHRVQQAERLAEETAARLETMEEEMKSRITIHELLMAMRMEALEEKVAKTKKGPADTKSGKALIVYHPKPKPTGSFTAYEWAGLAVLCAMAAYGGARTR